MMRHVSQPLMRSCSNWYSQVPQAYVPEPTPSPVQQAPTLGGTGITIISAQQQDIVQAPHAPRPSWLSNNGPGQANVAPSSWSISLDNFIVFVRACMETHTWRVLAEVKEGGSTSITMYDLNRHFITPWTSGTGCSIAGLMDDNQGSVELMISHAWAGSVVESLSAVKTMINMFLLPKETRIFFCTLCMYQPQDNATGGLSIAQQLTRNPFAEIISQRPSHGMYIIHTSISEVYTRLWCVHEVDECEANGIDMFGAFDPASWNDTALKNMATIVLYRPLRSWYEHGDRKSVVFIP